MNNVFFLYFLLHFTLHGRNSPLGLENKTGGRECHWSLVWVNCLGGRPHGRRMRRDRIPVILHHDGISLLDLVFSFPTKRLVLRNPANAVAGANQCMDMSSLICGRSGGGGSLGLSQLWFLSCCGSIDKKSPRPIGLIPRSHMKSCLPRHEPYEPC